MKKCDIERENWLIISTNRLVAIVSQSHNSNRVTSFSREATAEISLLAVFTKVDGGIRGLVDSVEEVFDDTLMDIVGVFKKRN